MNLSHRHERRHDRAVQQAASVQPAALPDPPKGCEEWLAAKMTGDAKVEEPASPPKRNEPTTQEGHVLRSIKGSMIASEVAEIMGIRVQSARQFMRKLEAMGFLRVTGKRGLAIVYTKTSKGAEWVE